MLAKNYASSHGGLYASGVVILLAFITCAPLALRTRFPLAAWAGSALDRRQLAYQVLLRIPVGTVAWEEIAFRGVLQAALRRVLAKSAATAAASGVFGLWHIRPTAEALTVNRLAATRGARITAVTATVAGTAAAGVIVSYLRERSGSLAAPVILHLTANCVAPLASSLARALDR